MASPDIPEVEDLPFYKRLTSNFNDLYMQAKEECSFIIIPQNLSNASLVTRDVFESHVFRPSSFFVRKYDSWNGKYEIEFDNSRTLRIFCKKDGAGKRLVKILAEEEVRNSTKKRCYRLLIVEQPLVDISAIKIPQNGLLVQMKRKPYIPLTVKEFNITSASYESSFVFLDSLQIEPAFERLRTALFLFNETYVILPKFIENTLQKLHTLRTEFLQEAYRLLNKNFKDRDIELASEIYITGNVYTKIWPIILQQNEDKDKILIENIERRKRNEQKNSSRADLNKSQTALNELKKLDDLKSSYEKAKCIHSALELTMAAKTLTNIDPKTSAVSYHPSSYATPMAADETLTAFIDIICQLISTTTESNVPIRLVAHEYYTEKFRFSPLPQDVDYAFTTYQGVIEYLTNSSSWF